LTINYLAGLVPIFERQMLDSAAMVSGAVITGSALSLLQPEIDYEDSFTQRELDEIRQSLNDIKNGRVKTFKNTEDLFADLDGD